MTNTTNSGADFCPERKHRFMLWRIWSPNKPLIMYIGLNPSTANERKPDPTIRRVTKFTDSWGYGGFYMMNLFPFVTSKPKLLQRSEVDRNNDFLLKVSLECEMVVFCWGAFPKHFNGRDQEVIKMFPGAYCFGLTQSGHPMHPLFLPKTLRPTPFKENRIS